MFLPDLGISIDKKLYLLYTFFSQNYCRTLKNSKK